MYISNAFAGMSFEDIVRYIRQLEETYGVLLNTDTLDADVLRQIAYDFDEGGAEWFAPSTASTGHNLAKAIAQIWANYHTTREI